MDNAAAPVKIIEVAAVRGDGATGLGGLPRARGDFALVSRAQKDAGKAAVPASLGAGQSAREPQVFLSSVAESDPQAVLLIAMLMLGLLAGFAFRAGKKLERRGAIGLGRGTR